MSSVDLLYGRGTLSVSIPEGCMPTVIRKRPMPIIQDPASQIAEALANPVGVPSLKQLAREAASACILICDITRPVPNGLFLGPLIRVLMNGGIARERISILVATGLHRPNLGQELGELINDPWVLKTVTVHNHDARSDDDHATLGTTPNGVRVRLDRRLVEADLRIATGLVEPHLMAGYSGGRKVIAPGVAHAETITTLHNSTFMSNPLATNCVLEGNPLHEEQLEIVKMLGGALALNTVIDEQRRLSFVNFGEIIQSHLEAVGFTREFSEVSLPMRFNTVVTSAAGYPLDKTYYQTIKGIVGPLDIVEPGGDLIVASECSEGLGSGDFQEAQRRLVEQGEEGFLATIADKPHAAIDEWQTQMQLRTSRTAKIHLVSGLDAVDRQLTNVQIAESVEAALVASMARHGTSKVAFIPEGPYIVPRKAMPNTYRNP